MAFLLPDRVMELSTTTGTGTITLLGAVTGFQSFTAVGDSNSTRYCIEGLDSSGQLSGEWEVGYGTFTSSGTTFSRDTILASSNSGSAVNFSSGFKRVFVADLPSPTIYSNGVSVLPGVSILDFKDFNTEVTGRNVSIYHGIPGFCQGRLTPTQGTPVTVTDVTAAGTIYFTPFTGNKVSLFDGTRWKLYTFAERSLALSSLTSGKNYDVFLYDNAGTLTLELSSAWTNDTTRADALTTQDGVYVKSGATTRLWLGTFRATGTATTEKSARRPFIDNWYNPVPYAVRSFDTTDTWTYTSGWRLKRNDGNNAIELVVGMPGRAIYLHSKQGQTNSSASVNRAVAIGYDATNAPATGCQFMVTQLTIATELGAQLSHHPGVGYHYYAELEYSVASGTTTWYGDGGDTAASKMQTGMSGLWNC